MSSFYEMVGRIVVRFVWIRYSRELKIAGAGLAAGLAAAAYLAARRQPPEG